jgi:hypothetical protein
MLACGLIPTHSENIVLVFHEVIVHPNHRRQNIGKGNSSVPRFPALLAFQAQSLTYGNSLGRC